MTRTRKRAAPLELPSEFAYSLDQAAFRTFGVPRRFASASLVSYEALGGDTAIVDRVLSWFHTGIDEGRWLYLWGPQGVGKTSLAVAISALAIGKGRTPYFWNVVGLLDQLRTAIGNGQQATELQAAIADLDLVVLDDLGAQTDSEWAVERLRLLLGERHAAQRPTIITSNASLTELRLSVGEATVWRIAETSSVVHVHGPNLRAAAVRLRRADAGAA